MEIVYKPFRNGFKTAVAVLALSFIAKTAMARPGQLSVLELIIGESTPLQVQAQSQDKSDAVEHFVTLKIGGYLFLCSVDFRNGKLDSLYCPFGRDALVVATPEAGKQNRVYAPGATEVYPILVNGFIEKFGKPDYQYTGEANRYYANWRDRYDSRLTMFLTDNLSQGSLTLQSAENVKALEAREKERKAAENAGRKF
ncbi:MAG: hypothetical protein PHC99_09580 [Methylococcales bacterium]|nr:hypothetical protein [Methylococcales bacterium]